MQQLSAKEIAELTALVASLGYELKRPRKPRKAKGPYVPYQWTAVSEVYAGPCCPPSRNAEYLDPVTGQWKVVRHTPGATEIREYFERVKAGNISHCRALVRVK